ncbi:unnamed protein product [Prunus armeniaca]|uniref:Retrotransposon gag domain-containing protein n=1 Tax=Prunus armeniaca TaxID=36596 RepID=A0A6J5XKT5_PRUAR|nr:unnamed protein product [Prunus armeniaca]
MASLSSNSSPSIPLSLTDVNPNFTLMHSITIQNIGSKLNLAYELWHEKDQNLIIWLNSTLSDDLIHFTVGITSAHELWQILEKRFAGVSRSHIHKLQSCLQSAQKGFSLIYEYLRHIKSIFDALAAAGTSVDESDLIAIILNGLLMSMSLL